MAFRRQTHAGGTYGLLTVKIAICLLAALAPAYAHAEMHGVWEGTIGRSKVVACLPEYGAGGTYYYRRHLTPIPLVKTVEGEWDEYADGKNSGHWQLKQAGDDALTGTWSKPGSPGLAIRLARPAGADHSCAGDAFNAPLEKDVEVARGEGYFGDHRYETLQASGPSADLGTFEVVQLREKTPAANAINLALRAGFADDRPSFYDCRRNLLETTGNFGGSPDYPMQSLNQEIVFWNRHLLSVKTNVLEECGGRFPGARTFYRTWDLATGRELDLDYWFGTIGEGGLPAPAKRLVLARAAGNKGPEPACTEQLETNRSYEVAATDKGLLLYTNFISASRNCDEEILVSYGEILKFLTPEARAALGK